MATVEERLAALEQAKEAVERQLSAMTAEKQDLKRRVSWWRGATGLALLLGLLLGYPQFGQAQGTVETRLAVLEGKLARVSVANGGADIIISGANLNIVNGAGSTQTANGLGNLIIGYNEARGGGADFRTGSHNLVLGQQNNYTSFGGIAGGVQNQISGPFAHVFTGFQNGALSFYSCVTTGEGNNAAGLFAAVLGGDFNVASGSRSCVVGGSVNTASGPNCSVAGGRQNTASADVASVSGGFSNTASGPSSAVSGGSSNIASGGESVVSGGTGNTAGALSSTVGGGHNAVIGTAGGDSFDWRAADTVIPDS